MIDDSACGKFDALYWELINVSKQCACAEPRGLNLPYGPAAERMKLACADPWAPHPPDPPF